MADLRLGDVAQSDRTELALVSHRFKLGELAVEIDDLITGGEDPRRRVEAAQVDDVDPLGGERSEVRLHARAELLGSLCGDQVAVRTRLGADLGGEDEIRRVGCSAASIKRFASPDP